MTPRKKRKKRANWRAPPVVVHPMDQEKPTEEQGRTHERQMGLHYEVIIDGS